MAATWLQTVGSRERERPPVAGMMRKMTSRMNKLQDEIAMESCSSVEFEQQTQSAIEYLNGQVRTVKEAFNTLAETLLKEVDHLKSSVRSEVLQSAQEIARKAAEERQREVHEPVMRRIADWQADFARGVHDASAKQQDRHEQSLRELEERLRREDRLQEVEKLADALSHGLAQHQEKQQDLEKWADVLARTQEEHIEKQERLARQQERFEASTLPLWEQREGLQKERQQELERAVRQIEAQYGREEARAKHLEETEAVLMKTAQEVEKRVAQVELHQERHAEFDRRQQKQQEELQQELERRTAKLDAQQERLESAMGKGAEIGEQRAARWEMQHEQVTALQQKVMQEAERRARQLELQLERQEAMAAKAAEELDSRTKRCELAIEHVEAGLWQRPPGEAGEHQALEQRAMYRQLELQQERHEAAMKALAEGLERRTASLERQQERSDVLLKLKEQQQERCHELEQRAKEMELQQERLEAASQKRVKQLEIQQERHESLLNTTVDRLDKQAGQLALHRESQETSWRWQGTQHERQHERFYELDRFSRQLEVQREAQDVLRRQQDSHQQRQQELEERFAKQLSAQHELSESAMAKIREEQLRTMARWEAQLETDKAAQESRHRDASGQQQRLNELEARVQQVALDSDRLQKRAESSAHDLESMIGVIPQLEDSLVKTRAQLQDRLGVAALDASRLSDDAVAAQQAMADVHTRLEQLYGRLGATEEAHSSMLAQISETGFKQHAMADSLSRLEQVLGSSAETHAKELEALRTLCRAAASGEQVSLDRQELERFGRQLEAHKEQQGRQHELQQQRQQETERTVQQVLVQQERQEAAIARSSEELERRAGCLEAALARTSEELERRAEKQEVQLKAEEAARQDQLQRGEEGAERRRQELEDRVKQLGIDGERLQKQADGTERDMKTVLTVMPSLEDTILQTKRSLEEQLGAAVMDIGKLSDVFHLEQARLEALEQGSKVLSDDLREELDQRQSKQQKQLTKQLEAFSRVLASTSSGTSSLSALDSLRTSGTSASMLGLAPPQLGGGGGSGAANVPPCSGGGGGTGANAGTGLSTMPPPE